MCFGVLFMSDLVKTRRLGPYRNNEEERKMIFDAEVSTPLVGVGAGLEFGVYKKTDEKDNHGKKDP